VTARNIELSKENDVLIELSSMIAADPESGVIGYNVAGLDTLAIKDADLRCGAQSLFYVALKQMDLHKSQIVKVIKNSFPEGCGLCQTDLQLLRHIIELATPGYFKDITSHWHDVACDTHVLRYNTQTMHMLWSCL